MDSISDISNGSVNSTLERIPNNSENAKLRRLKIQEGVLFQNIKKTLPNTYEGQNDFIELNLNFKKYASCLKKTCTDINNLFEELKITTRSQDMLKTIDIDDVKKDVIDLECRIKNMKTFLQREMLNLKSDEKDIKKQLNDDFCENSKIKKNFPLKTRTYSGIVQSPVKNLIYSPLKYKEVQQFQDFKKENGKYGSWNEYNHNIFVRIWQKHNGDDYCFDVDNISYYDNCFIAEVLEKISGVTKSQIVAHMKWFSKYVFLKNRQQIAVEEWRAKTKPNKVKKKYYEENDKVCSKRNRIPQLPNDKPLGAKTMPFSEHNLPFSTDDSEDSISKDCTNVKDNCQINDVLKKDKTPLTFKFALTTKQWENRCKTVPDGHICDIHIDNVMKLGIPAWRIGL